MNNGILHKLTFIVFLLTCVGCTVDSHWFVYPSLSRSLLLEVGILALSLCALCHVVPTQRIRAGGIFFALWSAYIFVHGILSATTEEYRLAYLCMTILSVIPMAYLLSEAILTRRDIETGLILIAVIQLIYVGGQLAGYIESGSYFFRVTGCNENPTVTALYLTGCMPLVAKRATKDTHRMFYVTLSVLSLIAIITLRCRTAYIGLCVEITVWTIMFLYDNPLATKKVLSHKWQLGFVGVFIISIASARLYDMKRDSAAGRLLVWKLSASMIAGQPLGYGIGLFEKEYNLHQADYFRSGKATDEERHNADFTTMAYNDYLEHGVEGGLTGMMLLIGFYSTMIMQAVRHKQKENAAVIAAFAVMSLTNFIYTSIHPWWLLMCYASFVTADSKKQEIRNKSICNTLYVTLIALFAVIFYHEYSKVCSQIRLAGGQDNIMALQPSIGTSEAFWRICARKHIKEHDYHQALRDIRTARLYTSSPILFMMEYHCLTALDDTSESMARIDTLSMMQPSRLTPKYLLMKHYIATDNDSNVIAYAYDIIQIGEKIKTAKSSFIMSQAKQYVQQYQD